MRTSHSIFFTAPNYEADFEIIYTDVIFFV